MLGNAGGCPQRFGFWKHTSPSLFSPTSLSTVQLLMLRGLSYLPKSKFGAKKKERAKGEEYTETDFMAQKEISDRPFNYSSFTATVFLRTIIV